MDSFTHWYKREHRHTGIGLHTPADVHFGFAAGKAADRRSVLDTAREQHPHRFGNTVAPKILDLPDSVWINRTTIESEDAQDSETERLNPLNSDALTSSVRLTKPNGSCEVLVDTRSMVAASRTSANRASMAAAVPVQAGNQNYPPTRSGKDVARKILAELRLLR